MTEITLTLLRREPFLEASLVELCRLVAVSLKPIKDCNLRSPLKLGSLFLFWPASLPDADISS